MTAKGARAHNRGRGNLVSTTPGARFPYKRWGKYWVSEEAFLEYAAREAARKRAKDAGLGRDGVDAYLEMEKEAKEAQKLRRMRERRERLEFDRLRLKHGLGLKANRQALKKCWERTKDPEILAFLHLQSTLTMNDTERVNQIRKLFLDDSIKPYDVLYRTAIIVGISLRKKS